MNNRRIEYLDALRGFTMILVILNHVAAYNLNIDVYQDGNFHFYLRQFRMPLFFFVSGFVFYKANFFDDVKKIFTFLKKKISVQLISPFIFLLCYIWYRQLPMADSILSDTKVGYWFTFTLFNYFVIYIVLGQVLKAMKIKEDYRLLIIIIIGLLLYNFGARYYVGKYCGIPTPILDFIGAGRLHYFFFFILGITIRKNFSWFENKLDNSLLTAIAVTAFFAINIFVDYNGMNEFVSKNIKLLLGVCGIIIVFSFFRKNETYFSQSNVVSKTLQFIGKRTLDIYLLHFFFLSYNLPYIFPFFAEHNLPVWEFAVSLIMTFFIMAIFLLIGSVLRINPTMAHYLFGAKKKQ